METRIRATQVSVLQDKQAMGQAVASEGAAILRDAIARRGEAFIIVATGASQFEFLQAFIAEDVDFSAVTMFHLDEYIGVSETHPASFRKYLKERLTSKVKFKASHFLDGDAGDAAAVCRRVGKLLSAVTIDAAFVGIGENGHLAFNDPPADFDTIEPYLIVQLDEACRRQQLGEGWFATLADVPTQAISMSVREILRARTIFCTCPDERKALAVKNTLDGLITPALPASILRTHGDCRFFLDDASAGLLAK